MEVFAILKKLLSLLGSDRWKMCTAAIVAVTAVANTNPSTASSAYIALVAIVAASRDSSPVQRETT